MGSEVRMYFTRVRHPLGAMSFPFHGASFTAALSMIGCKSPLLRRCVESGRPKYLIGNVVYLAGSLVRISSELS